MQYTLMFRDQDVLEFDIDPVTGEVGAICFTGDPALAPLGVMADSRCLGRNLQKLVSDRTISSNRDDLSRILEATGTRSATELALRSGGFSLSDQYWYREEGSRHSWRQTNFFDNDWDPSFGDAVLREDYDGLAAASIVTPDATCAGMSRKAWVCDEQGPLLLKAAVSEEGSEIVGQVLASRMLARLLPEEEYVDYGVVVREGIRYSSCRPFVGPGENLAMAWQVISAVTRPEDDDILADEALGHELFAQYCDALSHLNAQDSAQALAKIEVVAHLMLDLDLHPRNTGAIQCPTSGTLRTAPFFDFDRVFGLVNRDRLSWATEHPKLASLLAARAFSNLDPAWDYSWYDPHALDGFEDEIVGMLSADEGTPTAYVELIARLFVAQRAYLDQVVASGEQQRA